MNARENFTPTRKWAARMKTAATMLDPAPLHDEQSAVLRHDMLNCLMAMRLRLEVMRRTQTLSEAESFPLQESLQRMEMLVQDWRSLTEGGISQQPPTLYNLTAVVRNLVEANRPQALLKNQSLLLENDDSPVILTGCVNDLQRAVDNLISNAIKYTPEQGTVTIRLHMTRNHVCLCIQDTGIGIPEDELAHIFETRFRASNALQHGIPGTGLGLAQVRDTVEAHDGTIRITSEPGTGTQVEVWLPLEVNVLVSRAEVH